MALQLSSYAEALEKQAKARYEDKISLINGVDPFRKVTEGGPLDGFLPVEDCDLVSYLVLQTSFVTLAQLKARKGLETYNRFICGWIKEVSTRKIAGRYLTTGRISQVIKRVYTYFIALVSCRFAIRND